MSNGSREELKVGLFPTTTSHVKAKLCLQLFKAKSSQQVPSQEIPVGAQRGWHLLEV